jgi:tRNA 5-methylaminomethyl-2-thiouridine biosynthesis bifunctional protein
MQALLQAQGLPNSHVQALGAEAASVLAGVDLGGAWWHFPGAGWLAPGDLVASWLGQRGISTHFNTEVTALEPREGGGWCALGANGEIVAEADVAVVAAASAGSALLAPWSDMLTWPLQSLRGQLTQLSPALVQALALQTPRLPLVAGGYALALPEALGGGLLCGATQHADDDCSFLRAEDHRSNLEVAARLGPALQDPASQAWCVSQLEAAGAGRVGWRHTTADRLPVVGAVPVPSVQLLGQRRLEQPRHVPRVEGLYTLCALGSRGITWAPLLGEVLAAWVTGSPQPIGADLLDAMDPARFLSRQLRRPPAKV